MFGKKRIPISAKDLKQAILKRNKTLESRNKSLESSLKDKEKELKSLADIGILLFPNISPDINIS